jgi:hypothetical protein
MNQNIWAPVSSLAYGANAVFIPEYGIQRTLELILVMNQNYPEFKTHPVLDIFHGYIRGAERFEHSHEMRILGWDITPDRRNWSFVYLPTSGQNVRATAIFSTDGEGRLSLGLKLENPSAEARQWEFHLYLNPCEGLDLPECSITPDRVGMNGIAMNMRYHGLAFRSAEETDSNSWINFPLNAEVSEVPDSPRNRYKKRIRIRTAWIDLAPGEIRTARIDFTPDGLEPRELPPWAPGEYPASELPWRHALWEARHNHQYSSGRFRPIPARQWGRMFIWDNGMAGVGMADDDPALVLNMLDSLPEAEAANGFGSYIITAVYALWELYRGQGDLSLLQRYYPKLKALVLNAFDTPDGLASADRGTGADDSPALFYANGSIFSWDYRRTLPTNPRHERLSMVCVGLTALAVRQLKILRIFASLLGEEDDFSSKIETVENTLNERYWSAPHRIYLDRLADEEKLLEIPWIYGCLPLFSGSVPGERLPVLLEKLKQYQTPSGFMIIEPDSPYFRNEGYPNGSIWPPLQYFFWKTMIGLGRMADARAIAEGYLELFDRNHRETLCCWEQFRADTGRGAGNSRFSGFQTSILGIRRAHRVYGAVQAGYDILIESVRLHPDGAALRLRAPFFAGHTGISIVLQPDTVYEAGCGVGQIRSDAYGWIGLTLDFQPGQVIEFTLKKRL